MCTNSVWALTLVVIFYIFIMCKVKLYLVNYYVFFITTFAKVYNEIFINIREIYNLNNRELK